MFVLWIGRGVSIDALLLTLGGLLRPLAGWTGSIHVVLAGGDAVGSAACQGWVEFRLNLSSRVQFQFTLTNVGPIQSACHQTLLCPELPGRAGVATETSAPPQRQSVSSYLKTAYI